jgi:succinate dehydrogenase (ubiquinone) membrane anchor subunit
MASLVRPAMLKQGILSGSARRLFPSTAAALSTSPPTLIRPISTSVHSRRTLQPKSRTVSVASKIAPFHSSASRNILPPGPQKIEGGVNDPAPVLPPHPTEGSYHWVFERLLCVGLIPLTVAPFAAGSLNPTLDALLCASILIHSHIGFGYVENAFRIEEIQLAD